jgi:RNA polymerase sigma factor for flagellar operon FliA
MCAAGVRSDLWTKFVETREQKLRDELITEYAPLVRFVVGRLGIPPTSLLEIDDLVSYGMIGLINAIDRFDLVRGVPFEAFATPRIRGSVIDHLRSLNWQPRAAVSRVRQVEAALASVEQRMGRPAKEEEVADELGMSIERYRQILLDASATVLSLDVPVSSFHDEEMSPLKDLLEDEDAPGPAEEAERQELAIALSSAIEQLPEREQLLLALYYQEELTMKEISKVMSVSESRVCQLHMQAIMRLRGVLHTHRPEDPLPTGKHTSKRSQQKIEAPEKLPASQTEEIKEVVAGGKHKRLVS